MTAQSELQLFLSYASPDQERVLPIYDYLTSNGYPNTWMDCKKLLPGQPWEHEVMRNLRKSEIIVIFLSHRSVGKRGVVQRELQFALKIYEEKLASDIFIIPIKLDSDVIVPDALTGLQWLEIDRPNSLDLLKQSLDQQSERLGFEPSNSVSDIDKIHVTKKITSEKWEGLPGYEVEYSIPVLHSTEFPYIGEVTKMIEADYLKSLHLHRRTKIEQQPEAFSWAQFLYQRTNTYDAHYSNIYHTQGFLSIVYNISWYFAGAAHPNHHIETFNYMLNPQFEIADIRELFTRESTFFPKLQQYVREQLLDIPADIADVGENFGREKLFDEEWVKNGTEDWEAFSAFAFSAKGLDVYFSPYQIGPYALGTHTITVPYQFILEELKKDYVHALEIYFLT